jgi:hypothetical protein
MKLNMQNVLKNKYVLYAVSALAVLNVLGYLSIGSMECLGVFALTALVCQQYNKNMTVCLLAAIFAANVVFGCGRIKENFTEGATPSPDGVATAVQMNGEEIAKKKESTKEDVVAVCSATALEACKDKETCEAIAGAKFADGACSM